MSTSLTSQLAAELCKAKSSVIFTGAGMSTASGIPDFRSPGGIWQKYSPVYFDEFMNSEAARHEYWRQKSQAHAEFGSAQPNLGHQIIAEWEKRNLVRGVITQNIDELHQLGGSRNVLELHGTARRVACMDCQFRAEVDAFVEQFRLTDRVPRCPRCDQGRLKHATVSFGQSLPAEILHAADQWCRECDLLIAIGTSLVVTPAADLPRIAVSSGARLAILNRDTTPLDDLADFVIPEDIVSVLKSVRDAIDARGRGAIDSFRHNT